MHNLESDLHVILDDIALDIHSYEEQAKIKANMTEAILVAMKSLASWDDDEDDTEIVDGRGLTVSQLVRKVANTKPSWGKMDVLDPDVLEDVFSYDEETSEEPENVFENAQQTTEAFDTPGRGRHRSDFTKK